MYFSSGWLEPGVGVIPKAIPQTGTILEVYFGRKLEVYPFVAKIILLAVMEARGVGGIPFSGGGEGR